MDDLASVADSTSRRSSFFACYLLCSQKPRCGRTYIGFTVNPRRRIRQHNGEITSGAFRTKKWRPWEMVLCLYGFPSQVHALQFEWAWQHPQKSLAVKEAISGVKALGGKQGKVMVMYKMLNIPKWNKLELTINFLSTKHLSLAKKCPCLPPQMQVKVGPLEDLPCYLDLDDSDGENSDAFDDDGVNDYGNDEDGNGYVDNGDNEIEEVNKESEDGVPCAIPTVTTNIEQLLQQREESPWMDHEDYREAACVSLIKDLSHSLPLNSSYGCNNPIEVGDTNFKHHGSVNLVKFSEERLMNQSKLESESGVKILVNLVSPESHRGNMGIPRYNMRMHQCNKESCLNNIEPHQQQEIESHELDMESQWKPLNGDDDIGADLRSNTPTAHPRGEETKSSLYNISPFSPLWSPSPCQKQRGTIDLSECLPDNIFSTPKLDLSASRPRLEGGYLLSDLRGKQSEIIDLTSSPIVP